MEIDTFQTDAQMQPAPEKKETLPTKQTSAFQTEEEQHASRVINRQKRFGVVLPEERPKKKLCVDATTDNKQSTGTYAKPIVIHTPKQSIGAAKKSVTKKSTGPVNKKCNGAANKQKKCNYGGECTRDCCYQHPASVPRHINKKNNLK